MSDDPYFRPVPCPRCGEPMYAGELRYRTDCWTCAEERRQKNLAEQYATGFHGYGSGCYKIACVVCGDAFYAEMPTARYCSYRCRNDASIERQKARRHAKLQKRCPVCDKDFVGTRRDAVFCSGACRQKNHREALRVKLPLNSTEVKAVTLRVHLKENCPQAPSVTAAAG